jgi:hypothetical protein
VGGDLRLNLSNPGQCPFPAPLQFRGRQVIGRIGGIVLAESAVCCVPDGFEIAGERLTDLIAPVARLSLGSSCPARAPG